MSFEPIAVIGQACVLPGALNPEQLWEKIHAGADLLTDAPDGYWRIDPRLVTAGHSQDAKDITWSTRGGYVRGFESVFDPQGFAIEAEEVMQYDQLVQWLLHSSREALKDAGYLDNTNLQIGGVFGNLSYPSHAMAAFAESVWLDAQGSGFYGGRSRELAQVPKPHPLNRFMSGLPAHVVARALGLKAGAFAIDASCASSLFAIKIACDKLHDRKADLMLAGGVNRSDDLIIHIGFCTLQAMSHTGRSRPFHAEADGLVPCEGAGIVALKRLDDAISDGDPIHAVIRGVGLSNDGKGHGLLVPCEEGQYRAMENAYRESGINPSQISLLECHATGTVIGDEIEVRSTSRIFADVKEIPVGTIKSNMGHPITASGAAGLIKVIGAMKAGVRPATLHVDRVNKSLDGTPCRVLTEAEPWPAESPRMAAISNFGFGGNNAHLIVEQWDKTSYQKSSRPKPIKETEVAIVGMGAMVASGQGIKDFAETIFTGEPALTEEADGTLRGTAREFELPLMGLRFFPAALDQTLPQQLLILKATLEAVGEVKNLPNKRAGAFVGMGCDGEVTRSGMCWRLPEFVLRWLNTDELTDEVKQWIENSKNHINPAREASAIVGAMPNIVANRLCSQFDLEGQSLTVSSEELSGIRSLELAIRALRSGELDAAVVGAVDLSCEFIHQTAVLQTLEKEKHTPGDAAVSLVLKRLPDAKQDGDRIYAIVSDRMAGDDTDVELGYETERLDLPSLVGHSHAASGLLNVASAALACYHRAQPRRPGEIAHPWFSSEEREATIVTAALGGESSKTRVSEYVDSPPGHLILETVPKLHIYSGRDRNEVIRNLHDAKESNSGPARLVLLVDDKDHLATLSKRAEHILQNPGPKQRVELFKDIFFYPEPMQGELAFVFTGTAGVYPAMGLRLLLAIPELIEEICSHLKLSSREAKLSLDSSQDELSTPEAMLLGSTFICQIHAQISQKFFGLKPQATIGFSSGESNALFAMGVWHDLGEMSRKMHDMRVFSDEVAGEFKVVKRAWKSHGIAEVDWINYGVLAPDEEVIQALEPEPLAHLLIRNAPGDMVFGGQVEACQRVLDRIGKHRCYPLPYNIANHCPEIEVYAEQWRDLHHRETTPVPGVRFYTGATGSHYQPTSDLAAEHFVGLATRKLDFPKIVENAYNDGVRIFLEHGPRNRCSSLIDQILGDTPHLAVALDAHNKSSVRELFYAMAQLVAVGMPIDHEAFRSYLLSPERTLRDLHRLDKQPEQAMRQYLIHPPPIGLLEVSATQSPVAEQNAQTTQHENDPVEQNNTQQVDAHIMEPAPALPSALGPDVVPLQGVNNSIPDPLQNGTSNPPSTVVYRGDNGKSKQVMAQTGSPANRILNQIAAHNSLLAQIHRNFIQQQAQVHQRFIAHRRNALSVILGESPSETGLPIHNVPAQTVVQSLMPSPSLVEVNSHSAGYAEADSPVANLQHEEVSEAFQHHQAPEPTKPVAVDEPAAAEDASLTDTTEAELPLDNPIMMQFVNPKYIPPTGPTFSKEQLMILASGKISDVFGPMFKPQDDRLRQVRLPEPPLLLADRIVGLDAVPGSMGKGLIWTETDVLPGSWYLNEIYMPAGIAVESGQCDLSLISYLGADLQHKGDRVYRLLGCDLVYYGSPPKVGDTLCYQIGVDGHANMGDVRIFFFRYDCRIDGELRLSVRNAQAGFFTDEELAASGGVLWDAETGEHKPDDEVVVTPPAVECTRNAFTKDQVRALSDGHPYECFGPGWEITQTHSRTPRLPEGMMLMLDEITCFDPKGGPWGRGYLRVENRIPSDAWYLVCHFKNDYCMPGTLMADACLQTLAFYIMAMGYSLNKDGWRFDPVPGEVLNVKCRGQVTPDSDLLVYETFIEEFEIVDGLYPTIYGDVLATCDGLKMLHVRHMGVRLIPDWPLEYWPHLLEGYEETRPVAQIGDLKFDYRSLLACAWGKPSHAFGEMAKVFDTGRHISRLPSPPYHFMSRVSKIDATMGGAKTGETIQVEYDVPTDYWYFNENGFRTMPYSIIMEVGLQPSGWLAVFEGGPGASDKALYFRNLDGTATLHKEILPDTGIMRTTTTLTNIARIAGVTLVNFDVEIHVNDELYFDMKTGFGFFPADALAMQVGLGATEDEVKWLDEPNDFYVELTERPAKYCEEKLRLAGPMLLMLDRVTGYWPDYKGKGLPRLRAEKKVNVREWFFKAHFFHDPVQPGSLGVEAIIQLLQFYMIHENLHEGMKNPRFLPIAIDHAVTWKYRGQITIDKKRAVIEMNILDKGRDEKGVWALAEAWYWADELRIYSVKDLKMYIIDNDALSED